MYEVLKTSVFIDWLNGLRDKSARYRIGLFIKRIESEILGDHKPVGDGVYEFRFHYGPGYRIYYVICGRQIIILLCGGDKASQSHDIKHAKRIAKEV